MVDDVAICCVEVYVCAVVEVVVYVVVVEVVHVVVVVGGRVLGAVVVIVGASG